MHQKMDWSDRLKIWALCLMLALFWTVVAYGVSHWRGAPFSPWALGAVFVVTTFLALLVFALLWAGKDN